MDGESSVLRGGALAVWMTVCWAVCAVVGLSLVRIGDALSTRVLGVAVLVVAGWMGWGLVRSEVRADPSHLLVRTAWRTRRLAWDDVAGAAAEPGNPVTRLFAVLRIDTVSGRTIKVEGIGDWLLGRDPAQLPVCEMAAAINKRRESTAAQ